MSKEYDVAAFVWPSYTGDDVRARMFWAERMDREGRLYFPQVSLGWDGNPRYLSFSPK